MSDLAIRVENLTKKFYLGERVGIKTFREALQDLVTAPFRVWKRNGNGDGQEKLDTEREIWALKGVSFEVKHGEVLGIIGPNGAGKSTLLKILSRITEPTGGYAEIRGRVGSLLEVGTGFHPELTGRENVYLNGSILGMSKSEIRRKFDDIVSFAGVEKFIDTPVKRYSSGMQVRLAFAVAAHLDPEILIIDEVLAVGDAEFQKRCLGKMDEVSRSGRTILFVSHNMAAVQALCRQCLLLEDGNIRNIGECESIINQYLGVSHVSTLGSRVISNSRILSRVELLDGRGNPRTAFRSGEELRVKLTLRQDVTSQPIRAAVILSSINGTIVTKCYSYHQCVSPLVASGGESIVCAIRGLFLAPGHYSVTIALRPELSSSEDWENLLGFDIVPTDVYGTGRLPSVRSGLVLARADWQLIS
jgi:lipopolysaccharide transport system ATP-binding protein